MSEQLADVLDRAADYLEDGWIQGRLHGEPPPDKFPNSDQMGSCAVGSIDLAAEELYNLGWSDVALQARNALGSYLIAHELWFAQRIPIWNDYTRRTKQQVLDAFRGCAKEQRE